MRKVWSLAVLMLALLLTLTLAACEGGSGDGSETDAATTGDATTAAPETEDTTAPEGGNTTAPESESTEAEGPTGVPKNNKTVTFFQDENAESYLKGTNCDWELVTDADRGTVLKMTSNTDTTCYPQVAFDYAAYMRTLGIEPISTEEAGVIVVTVKSDNCTSGSFDLLCSTEEKPKARSRISVWYDLDKDGWQTLVLPIGVQDPWKGETVGTIRLNHGDDIPGGEVMYVHSLQFYRDLNEFLGSMEELQKYQLGYGSSLTVQASDPVDHVKQDAPDEDASVDLWFDHITEKTVASDITSSGKVGYTIRLAKNDISDCQFFLSPETDRTFRIELDTLTHESGATLDTSLYFTYYHDVGKADKMPDAIPPVQGPMSVKGNNSQGFVIKAKAAKDTAAGLYSAELRIYDNETGAYIKKATVCAYVWDFTLTDDTSLSAVMQICSWWTDYLQKSLAGEHTVTEAHKIYYDFLLENRINGYDLPVSPLSEEANAYLDNPRVNLFLDWYGCDPTALWDKLSSKPEWMEKFFAYGIDEPNNEERMQLVKEAYEQLSQYYPGIQMSSPLDIDYDFEGADQIERLSPYVSIWCTKDTAYIPREFYTTVNLMTGMQSEEQNERYGIFTDRMAEEVADGDRLWTYYCYSSQKSYPHWMADGDGVNILVSLWQCKQNDVTGILVWAVNFWRGDGTTMTSYDDISMDVGSGMKAYGDGTLVYPGAPYGLDTPVSSIRLETAREGIEDYEYLCMLEELYGEETVDELISLISGCTINYTKDDDYLAAVRVMLGDMIEAGMKSRE